MKDMFVHTTWQRALKGKKISHLCLQCGPPKKRHIDHLIASELSDPNHPSWSCHAALSLPRGGGGMQEEPCLLFFFSSLLLML